MNPSQDAIIQAFFRAMQAGAASAQEMFELFTPDAVYVEPFSGAPLRHEGIDAIRAVMRAGWERPLPDFRIEVRRVDVDGPRVTAHWTCHSPALPQGRASGINMFDIAGGKIERLETVMEP